MGYDERSVCVVVVGAGPSRFHGGTCRRHLWGAFWLKGGIEAVADVSVHPRAFLSWKSADSAGVIIHQHGVSHAVHINVVLVADGVELKFAKWAGIDTTVPLWDIEGH